MYFELKTTTIRKQQWLGTKIECSWLSASFNLEEQLKPAMVKDSDAGKDWGQEEKGATEDKMVQWHHWLNGHGFGWTPGVSDAQGGLACCSSWGCKVSDTTEILNWTELNVNIEPSPFPLNIGKFIFSTLATCARAVIPHKILLRSWVTNC